MRKCMYLIVRFLTFGSRHLMAMAAVLFLMSAYPSIRSAKKAAFCTHEVLSPIRLPGSSCLKNCSCWLLLMMQGERPVHSDHHY